MHVDLAVEHAVRPSVEHALVQLAAEAVRLRVDDLRLVIGVLVVLDHVQAVQRRAGAFAVERRVDVGARQRRAGRERERDVVAVARLASLRPCRRETRAPPRAGS